MQQQQYASLSHEGLQYGKQGLTTCCNCCTAGRKEMCNKIIPNLYTEIKEEKEALIKQDNPDDKDASKGAIATDGWKKKACAQGTPLISANVLLPNGGSDFYKVCLQ